MCNKTNDSAAVSGLQIKYRLIDWLICFCQKRSNSHFRVLLIKRLWCSFSGDMQPRFPRTVPRSGSVPSTRGLDMASPHSRSGLSDTYSTRNYPNGEQQMLAHNNIERWVLIWILHLVSFGHVCWHKQYFFFINFADHFFLKSLDLYVLVECCWLLCHGEF